jgi:hypothetical protein
MREMGLESRRHHKAERERRYATDTSIAVLGVLELLCLLVDLLLEGRIFVLEISQFEDIFDFGQIFFQGVFEFVDRFLKQLLFRRAVRIQRRISGYESEDGFRGVRVILLDFP